MLLPFSLEGTERVTYGEIDQVLDRLEAVAHALNLFTVKDATLFPGLDVRDAPIAEWMFGFTDGMTKEEIDNYLKITAENMRLLKNGNKSPYCKSGSLQIISGNSLGGVLLTMVYATINTELNFPYSTA